MEALCRESCFLRGLRHITLPCLLLLRLRTRQSIALWRMRGNVSRVGLTGIHRPYADRMRSGSGHKDKVHQCHSLCRGHLRAEDGAASQHGT